MTTPDYNPYTLLGISKDASPSETKKAYHNLAQRLHPDKNPMKSAEEQFQTVSDAYDLISDPIAGHRYDEESPDLSKSPYYFTLRALLSKQAISPMQEEQVVYVLSEIAASDAAKKYQEDKKEANLNLTLVLDYSNSMNENNRMERVRIAAQAIINQLDENDFISVVVFNNHADVIIPATPVEAKARLHSRIGTIQPKGGTAILQGLKAGITQNRANLNPKLVNHILLLTDGRTFFDEDDCIQLAKSAADDGISISAMGLGSDWNDEFLDELASITGGHSAYIDSTEKVVRFLNEHVRVLTNAFAERMQLSVAPDPDISLEMAFRLTPNPQPLDVESGILPLSSLQVTRPTTILLQLQLPGDLTLGYRPLARLVASGDILPDGGRRHHAVSDLSIEVAENPASQKPPTAIVDALSKLTLYQMQERAQDDIANGDIEEATRRLENLATRLYELGENQLARQTQLEAQNVARTQQLSQAGGKTIKYETRALIGPDELGDAITSLLDNQQD